MPQTDLQIQFTSIRISASFFVENDRLILEFTRNWKGSRTVKTILKQKNKVEELTTPNFKTYYQATVIKTVWSWHKDRHQSMDRIESSEINIWVYGQFIFYKGGKTIWRALDHWAVQMQKDGRPLSKSTYRNEHKIPKCKN